MRTNSILAVIFLLAFSPSAGAGIGGGGGSPPAKQLPNEQFTEVSLGILRGDDIQIRSNGIDRRFQPTAIDSVNGLITVTSPDEGDSILLQNFDKKFARRASIRNAAKFNPTGVFLQSKTPSLSIPVNPDVTTVPKETSVYEEKSE